MTPHGGDGDRNVGVCDNSLAFNSKSGNDDNGRRHQKKCRRHNDLSVTINDAAPCSQESLLVFCVFLLLVSHLRLSQRKDDTVEG